MLDMKLYWFCKYPKINIRRYIKIYIIFNDKIAADADMLYDFVTSQIFQSSFNSNYNPQIDYAFYLRTLKSSKNGASH